MGPTRRYSLGRRQAAVDQTAAAILAAARALVAEQPSADVSLGAIARRAGVSRITVYNRFGSKQGLLDSLAPAAQRPLPESPDPRLALREHLEAACARWAADPTLFRHLRPSDRDPGGAAHALAERLAAADALRPGCSLREAEDVIAALGSFEVFDGLHRDGRRAAAAVAEILMRLASGVLA